MVLFLPLGMGLATMGASTLHAALCALILSAGVEFLQVLLPGRDASWVDVATNLLGARIGARAWLRRWVWPDRRLAVRLAIGGAAVTSLLFAAAVAGFRAAKPPGPYAVHADPHRFPYPAPVSVRSSSWNGAALRCCPDSSWPSYRASLDHGQADLRVESRIDAWPQKAGRLVTVWDAASREVAVIGV